MQHVLQAGDKVMIDDGFTCMEAGVKILYQDAGGRLYMICREGKHFLDGQLGADGALIGVHTGGKSDAAQ